MLALTKCDFCNIALSYSAIQHNFSLGLFEVIDHAAKWGRIVEQQQNEEGVER